MANTNNMQIDEIKHYMNMYMERISNLHDRLSDTGKPLDTTDKKDIRHILVETYLDNMMNEMKYFFVRGQLPDVERGCDQIITTLEKLI